MKNVLLISFLFITIALSAQNSSLIVLGDLHYNLHKDHDLNWLESQAGNLVQESESYSDYTDKYWGPFMKKVQKNALSVTPPVKAIIQVGDLSEGLAGSVEKARQMMQHTVKAIDSTQMPVPWIIARGNHETYGPGANEAFQEFFVPLFREQTLNPDISNASYSYHTGNVQITCLDPWDADVDMVAFLEKELSTSKSKYKFIAIHEPVIPVTGYCWYALRQDEQQRNKLLELIAKHKAIVLTGHLHRYSIVSRKTAFGPVVQVMVVSVVKDSSYQQPLNTITEYGPSLMDGFTDWKPETIETRKSILLEESKYVTFFKQTDLPGYAIIKIDDNRERIQLEYYAAFGNKPYDTINLTELMQQ